MQINSANLITSFIRKMTSEEALEERSRAATEIVNRSTANFHRPLNIIFLLSA